MAVEKVKPENDEQIIGRSKSKSILLLDDLTIESQARRRHCILDTSMLPILEEIEPEYKKNSIFKTIVNDPNKNSYLPNLKSFAQDGSKIFSQNIRNS